MTEDIPAAPVWANTVDQGRFTVAVHPDPGDNYLGTLVVNVAESKEELLSRRVGLSYGAIFGPDVDDVNQWMALSIEVIDAWLANRGEEIPDNGT